MKQLLLDFRSVLKIIKKEAVNLEKARIVACSIVTSSCYSPLYVARSFKNVCVWIPSIDDRYWVRGHHHRPSK